MNKLTIEQQIKKYLSENLNIDDINLTDTSDSLGMDSLDDVEFVMAIEEMFDLEVTDYEAAMWHTLESVVDYVYAEAE